MMTRHHDHKKAKADVKVAEAEDRYKALPQQWNNAKRRYNDAVSPRPLWVEIMDVADKGTRNEKVSRLIVTSLR